MLPQRIPNIIKPLPELKVHIPLKGELRPYQAGGVAYGIEKECFINGDDMGLGKTLQAIATTIALNSFPCLVICPSSVKENWRREWHKFSKYKAIVLDDSIRYNFTEYARIGAAQVFIVNFESLKKYFVESVNRPADGGRFKVSDVNLKRKFVDIFKSVIVDEIHKVKELKTQGYKFTRAITKDKQFVMGLTGTMFVNKPMDLVAQLYIINRMGDFGGYKYFKNRFCSGEKNASNLAELKVLLNEICYYRRNKTDKDIKKYLPDKSRQIIMCDLSPGARKEYNHAMFDLKSYMKQYKDSTDEQVKKSLKGAVMVRIGILKNISARGKLKDAFDFIEDQISQGQKVVVFAVLNDIIQKVQERFPKSVRITGKENSLQKQASVDRFQSDPKINLIACNLKAAGTGTDGLQNAANVAAFIEFGWNSAIMDQAEDRLFRSGQNKNVMCNYFLGKNTIDEWNYELIESKRSMGNAITGAEDDVDVNIINGIMELLAA
jgi:SWI/SNF-related matrix-associated actin-dependent regulator 1 of chromatin subfamily A